VILMTQHFYGQALSEHPVLIVGYGADDSNIKSILSDIDEALPVSGDTIKNIYFVDWKSGIESHQNPSFDRLIPIEDAKSVRASNLKWVFDAFKAPEVLEKISSKTLRALMARSYELVRRDIPRKSVDVDFKMLEGAIDSSDSFAKLFGISTISDPSALNVTYPYTITTMAEKLGLKTWHPVHKLLEIIKERNGVDLKASDNEYHVTAKIGKTEFHKYSEKTVDLVNSPPGERPPAKSRWLPVTAKSRIGPPFGGLGARNKLGLLTPPCRKIRRNKRSITKKLSS